MNRKSVLTLSAVALVSGGISFLATRLAATAPDRGEAVSWLTDAPASVQKLEKNFNREADSLIAALGQRQKDLAQAIEDPNTADSVILARLDEVITAHEHLLRRVGEHITTLRSELPAAQRERLMNLCAQVFRGPMIRGGGRGPGYGGGNRMGRGPGQGAGRRMGGRGYDYGGGGGYGRGRRLGGGVAQRLRLTDEQVRVAEQQDPDFSLDSNRLRDALLTERTEVLAAFENPRTTNDELLRHIERLISAHSRLERRVAKHVLILRPHLSPDQQKWLIGLCRRGSAPGLAQ